MFLNVFAMKNKRNVTRTSNYHILKRKPIDQAINLDLVRFGGNSL